MLITLLLSALMSLIAPVAATAATVFLGGVFFVLLRFVEAPFAKQN